MARKKEGAYQSSIGRAARQLGVYYQSMAGTQTNGTPDAWFSGPHRDLWVEFKYKDKLPREIDFSAILTPIQLAWHEGRIDEGRDVFIVFGSPAGGVIGQITESTKSTKSVPKHEIVEWIYDITHYA